MTTTRHPRPDPEATAPARPRAEGVTHAIALVVLPVGIRRLPSAFGYGRGGEPVPLPGTTPRTSSGRRSSSSSSRYPASGWVRGWGEIVPHRMPSPGGGRIPPAPAIAPAAFGGLLFTALGIHWPHEAAGSGTAVRRGTGTVLAMTTSGLMNLWGRCLRSSRTPATDAAGPDPHPARDGR